MRHLTPFPEGIKIRLGFDPRDAGTLGRGARILVLQTNDCQEGSYLRPTP
jgi:hypothetical protein